MSAAKRRALVLGGVLAVAAAALGTWHVGLKTPETRRVRDEAGILRAADIPRFEEYLRWIFEESDVDIRFVFVKDLGALPIESAAVERMRALGIGRQTREERGVLFLYDVSGRRLRVELGYGLEEYFPDAFVGYLMHDHAREFFAAGDLGLGLRLTLRIVQDRVRSAVLGDRFDPRPLAIVKEPGHLSGGAGASASMSSGRDRGRTVQAPLDRERHARFVPQDDPGLTYRRYLEWLSLGRFDPSVTMFTPETRRHLAGSPMSKAYFDYLLLREYGKAFSVDARRDLALLYFTSDPLLDPHFFRKSRDGWQMDLLAEVRNTRNRVGGVYTWDYRGRDDEFSRTFADKFVEIKGYVRIAGGDNRELVTRVSRQPSSWNPFR